MHELKRIDGWRARLDRALDEARRKPFAWGSHDCGPEFAGRCIEAITGADIAAPWRGRYTTREGALRVIHEDGFADLADLVSSLLPEHEHVSRARVGDLAGVPVDSPFVVALGVVGGARVFVLRPEGLGTVSLLQCSRAWRVG